jgi:crotonobetainyl-CoA:carnitine CoA-transferase CaiB-like acyl-CoA transferase
VVEIASFVAAPSGGALLADLGAEVIKVEVPQGEIYRHARPSMNGYKSDFPESPAFQMDNRGKRSLALDLTRPAAREALLCVIDRSDVVLTNLLPRRAARFGLDDASLRARNPALVYALLTGYGARGPDADRPGFDYAAYWARTGFMDLMREPGQTPVWQRPGIGDHAAGISLVAGILAALRVRERTGRGQTVEVSLFQIGLYIQGNDLAASLATRQNPPPHDRTHPRNPLWNAYPTRDGWLFLVMVESDRYWPALCRAIEREELEKDARFHGAVARYRNSSELVALLDALFRSRTLAEWEKRFADFDLIWSPMRAMADLFDDPQVRAMGYFRGVDHPTAGRFETMGPPFDLSATPLDATAPAPALGADGEAVLREAGLGEAEIAAALDPRK